MSPTPQPARPSAKIPLWVILLAGLVVIGVPVFGVFASLAIVGFRRYIAASKVAEAKSTVASIAAAAVRAYESEEGDPPAHRLCASANPVPSGVAKLGQPYMPSRLPGEDFDAGSSDAGWKCLRFTMESPFRYQYRYAQGGGFVGPSAPGPNAFEAAAIGDLNGDGVTSKFARGGHVDASGHVVLDATMFIENEDE
jgi:type IV pilus assembly protein PilA